MKQHEIKMPDDLEYRVTCTGGRCFQPQYKDTGTGKWFGKNPEWTNFKYSYHDQRDGEWTECNKTFGTLEEANQYIDDYVKAKEIKVYYKTKD